MIYHQRWWRTEEDAIIFASCLWKRDDILLHNQLYNYKGNNQLVAIYKLKLSILEIIQYQYIVYNVRITKKKEGQFAFSVRFWAGIRTKRRAESISSPVLMFCKRMPACWLLQLALQRAPALLGAPASAVAAVDLSTASAALHPSRREIVGELRGQWRSVGEHLAPARFLLLLFWSCVGCIDDVWASIRGLFELWTGPRVGGWEEDEWFNLEIQLKIRFAISHIVVRPSHSLWRAPPLFFVSRIIFKVGLVFPEPGFSHNFLNSVPRH